MSYPRFFISKEDVISDRVVFTGDSASHIGFSLRMKAGEKVVACDGRGREYLCVLDEFDRERVTARIIDVCASESESPYLPVIVQACPKGDKADTVVMKSVELGASKIVFFVSSRCVVRYGEKDLEKKKVRWERIALEAAKQSGRGRVPEIAVLPDTDSAARYVANAETYLCYENESGRTLKDALSGKRPDKEKEIAFVIGPEGGFSEEEAQRFVDSGAVSVSLGKRILRTETASSFVLSCFSYENEL